MAEHEESEDTGAEGTDTSFDELLDEIDEDREEPASAGDDGSLDEPDVDTAEMPATDEATEDDEHRMHAMLDRLTPRRTDDVTHFDDLLARVRANVSKRTRGRDETKTRFPPLDAGESALVIGALGSERDDATCASAFEHVQPAGLRLILVSLTRRAPARLDVVRDAHDVPFGGIGHVHRGSGMEPDDVESVSVKGPGNLSQLGISISTFLRDWGDANDDIVVCIHSLSTLLQHADRQRVFRFLHVLLGRAEDVGARTHVHLDGERHDAETRILYEQLFDVTIRETEDGYETSR